ncbi:excisionase family protein [Klebsiella aerogenes]|uniref:excisionase family protein n=1 Tax=Klebsiella aerogenes TaxID=548 RepID=UPI003969D263
MMTDILNFQLQPNKWVTESVLKIVTGLRSGTIERARSQSWLVGREYLHIAPDGIPKENSECMYNLEAINRWIEEQAKRQPQK